jgi:hypothetical protein
MNIVISPKEYEKELNWNDGKAYCESLEIDDNDDWRMPHIRELYYIHNSENDFDDVIYWSSTVNFDNFAWCKNFSDGNQTNPNINQVYRIRPVRNKKRSEM